MKTFTFTTTSEQRVTILASIVTGMRRMNDTTFGPRTAIDTSGGAIYVVVEPEDEYESRVALWKATLDKADRPMAKSPAVADGWVAGDAFDAHARQDAPGREDPAAE